MIVVAIVALVETLIRLAGDYQLALLRPFTCPRRFSRWRWWAGGDGPGSEEDGPVAAACTRGVLFALAFAAGIGS